MVARQNSTLIRTQCDAVVASSGGGVCHNPPDTQADRDLPRQPAAGARGQAAQTGQQTKVQAPKQAAVGGAAVTAITAGQGAAVTSLEEACSRPLGLGQTRVQLGVLFLKI